MNRKTPEFLPEDLTRISDGEQERYLAYSVKRKRVEATFKRVIGTLSQDNSLKVYLPDAVRYICLGGNDVKFLKLAETSRS